jgi:hypothetical protein
MRSRWFRLEAGGTRETPPGMVVRTAIPTEVNCRIEALVNLKGFNRNHTGMRGTYIDQLCELDGKGSHIYVGRKYDLVRTKRHAKKAGELKYVEKG